MSRIDQYASTPPLGPNPEFPYNDPADTTQGANGSVKRAYGDQLGAIGNGLVSGAGITGLYAAIANRNDARVNIPVIGDSVTEGQGATDFNHRWIQQANRAIRYQYVTDALFTGAAHNNSLGFIPIASTGANSLAWPITQTVGTFSPFLIGPVRNCAQVTAAASFTFTAPDSTTSVQIMYFDAGVAGSFTYQVNSGSPVTVTSASTGVDTLTGSISMAPGDVLTISWVSGTVFLDGIIHYTGDENSGVTFHGCGRFGWAAGIASDTFSWNQSLESGFNWNIGMQALSPSAIGIMLGINDANAGGSNYTASQFQANVETLITYLRSDSPMANIPILLIVPYQPNRATADTGGWAAYTEAIRSVAAADVASFVIDLNYRMPTVASNWQGGTLYADTVHPSDLGHALIGEIVAAGLRIT